VGKGLKKGRKYVEVIGRNGNSVLIAFGDTNWRGPTQGDQKIAGGIYFVSKGQLTKKADLASASTRYAQLFVDMVTGERKAIISCDAPYRWGADRACSRSVLGRYSDA